MLPRCKFQLFPGKEFRFWKETIDRTIDWIEILFSKYIYIHLSKAEYIRTYSSLRYRVCRIPYFRKKEKEKRETKEVLDDERRNPASRLEQRLIKGTVELAFRVGAAAKFQIDRVQFGRALSNVVSCIMHGTRRAGWPPEYKSVRAVSFPPTLPPPRFTRFVVPGC